ncbi:MAG: MMPL family transporter [Pelagibacteraceae bacterium]|nr:MMPL family transporter [Pelagibacteraceae bacterium]
MPKIKLIFFISLALSILILSFFFIKNFRIDASSDTLVAQNDKDFEYFNNYSKLFKSENFLILAVENNNELNEEFIRNIESISSKILSLKSVSQVFSFIDAPIFFLNNTSLSNLNANNLENLRNTNLKIDEVVEEFIKNPIYLDQIVNKEANVFSVIIYLNKNMELITAKEDFKKLLISKKEYLKIKTLNDRERTTLINNLRNIINEADNKNTYYLGGVEMIASDVIGFVKNDILIFSLSVVLIIIFVLFFIFRQIKWVFLCLLSSAYSVIIIFGVLGLTQIEVTAISSNFSALIFILSISMNIHIINYYRLQDNQKNSLNNTFKTMFWPCFYTTLTTMVAFGSLIITEIKPIIDFGFIMLIGLTISLVCSFTILPLLIFIFPKNNKLDRNHHILKLNFLSIAKNNSKKIVFIAFLLFISSIGGIYNLSVENSFVNYFKKNTEIYKGMKLIDEQLGGTTPVDIILNFNEEEYELSLNSSENEEVIDEDIDLEEDFFDDDMFIDEDNNNWFSDEKLQLIYDIHEYLDAREEIGKVQSIKSLIDLANLINKQPLSIFELSILYEEVPDNYREQLIYPYLLIDENMARITARVRDSGNINRKQLIEDIQSFIKLNKNSSLENFKINGLLVLYNNMLDSLFSSQIKSLGFVIGLIFLMFLILFKSFKLSALGIIPNIFTSSMILGIIGYLSIPLDIMTITIAAITIGIAVDNTIHYLYRYKEFKKNNTVIDSIKYTNASAGLAVFTTSVTIALGFSILSLSSFIPTVIFGIFTSIAMVLAMIGVLLFLPSLLLISKND